MNRRIMEIEIAGTKYPLNFSTKAAREVSERYGGIENVGSVFEEKSIADALAELVWLLALLIEQGAAYNKIVNGAESKLLTSEELEIILGMADVVDLKETIMQTMTVGLSREVEVEPEKNAETMQGS